ncbi:cache domain-containing sensor histidine kinase [Paenibacillus puerhi]|uniref:cache domain-containing sensor histidine kinase n=1 Tax=Paenibacillus puerhi TaxID=2692622 RepID=UPI00135675E0|nr:sensor histidine kinase [Paenibacillus puerhi]
MKLTTILRQLSLRQKLIISSVVCLLLPAAITLSITNRNAEAIIQRHATDNALGTQEVMGRYIINTVNQMLYVSNYVQFDSEIQSAITQRWNETRLGGEDRFVEHFLSAKNITEKLENITFPDGKTHITILLADGISFTNYSHLEYNPAGFFQEPWFARLTQLPSFATYWIGTHPSYLAKDREKGQYFITIAKTMKSFSSEPFGYLIVSLSEEEISNIFVNQSLNQEHMLLDSSGMILSHADSQKIGKRFTHNGELHGEEGSSLITVDKEDYLLLHRKLPYSDWRLVSMVPYREAVSQINAVQGTNYFLQAFFFVLFLLILVTLVRQFTKPIYRLGRVVSRVEDGNLQIRTGIRGGDEISRLGQSFDRMLDRIEEMLHQVTWEQTRKRKAELAMLQAQINPHFLFNVLNSIRMRIKLKGDDENAGLISSLSSLLRMTINRNNEFVPLHEEVETVVHYFHLMNFRLSEPLALRTEIASSVALTEIPRFILQPVLENSIIHGFRDAPGTVSITAWGKRDLLVIEVSDTGRGMDEEELMQLERKLGEQEGEKSKETLSGIGLNNVLERLRLIYGETFHYRIESHVGEGTSITLHIPLKGGERHA